MRIRSLILLVAVIPAVALEGQASLPPDINPVTLSRLPPVNRNDLDAEGQRLLDARTNPANPGPGPGHITSYSPKIGEGLGPLGRYLGVPRGDDFPLGARSGSLGWRRRLAQQQTDKNDREQHARLLIGSATPAKQAYRPRESGGSSGWRSGGRC